MDKFPRKEYVKNRYYSRGDPPGCCDNMLRYSSKDYGNNVLSYNNPYVPKKSSFAQYLTFSNFKDRVLTLQDIETILFYYNKNYLYADNQYGPFKQVNLNFVGQMGYNEDAWNQFWKNYKSSSHYTKPIPLGKRTKPLKSLTCNEPKSDIKKITPLQDISYYISHKFVNQMNYILLKLNNKTTKFQLSKHRIINIFRSDKTNNIKFKLNIVLTRDTKSKAHTFEVYGYFNPLYNTLHLGKASYVGTGTTDTILLPQGYNKLLYEGRPLYKNEYQKSELMSDREMKRLYWKHLYKTQNYQPYYSYPDELPYWYRVFTGR